MSASLHMVTPRPPAEGLIAVHPIRCIAVEHLPAGAAAMITDRDDVVYVYLSAEHDLQVVAEALTLATTDARMSLVSLT